MYYLLTRHFHFFIGIFYCFMIHMNNNFSIWSGTINVSFMHNIQTSIKAFLLRVKVVFIKMVPQLKYFQFKFNNFQNSTVCTELCFNQSIFLSIYSIRIYTVVYCYSVVYFYAVVLLRHNGQYIYSLPYLQVIYVAYMQLIVVYQ